MSQCSFDDNVEVFWDHDSPTPAAWKALQDPPITQAEEVRHSPSMARFRVFQTKRAVRHHSVFDVAEFEKSRQEANRIIRSLQNLARENSRPLTEANLNVPPYSDVDSDEEEPIQTTPFKKKEEVNNTSMDQIFDRSGRGEELAATLKSTLHTQEVEKSFFPEVAIDDDLFNDNFTDEELMKTPPRLSARNIKVTTNKKMSTPCREIKETISDTLNKSIRGFVDFMMGNDQPVKPSPGKGKVTLKAVEDSDDDIFLSIPANGFCIGLSRRTSTGSSSDATVPGHPSPKATDISIPLDILEDIMDDSWTDADDHKPSHKRNSAHISPKAVTAPVTTTKFPSHNIQNKVSNVHMSTSVSHTKPLLASNEKQPNLVTEYQSSHTKYKFKPTNKSNTSAKQSDFARENLLSHTKCEFTKINKASASTSNKTENTTMLTVKKHKLDNTFEDLSTEDEEMLMEAATLAESQSSQGKLSQPKLKDEIKPSVKVKCSASEIERKKQMALNRKKQRMNR